MWGGGLGGAHVGEVERRRFPARLLGDERIQQPSGCQDEAEKEANEDRPGVAHWEALRLAVELPFAQRELRSFGGPPPAGMRIGSGIRESAERS